MRKIIKYECDICHSHYSEECDAKECEERGLVNPDLVPLYVLFEDDNTGFYKNIIFCVAEQGIYNSHWCQPSLWACRDTGFGDSIGEDMCSGGSSVSKNSPLLNESNGHINFKSERFKRMVEFLKSKNIPIRYWDGKNIKDYLK